MRGDAAAPTPPLIQVPTIVYRPNRDQADQDQSRQSRLERCLSCTDFRTEPPSNSSRKLIRRVP